MRRSTRAAAAAAFLGAALLVLAGAPTTVHAASDLIKGPDGRPLFMYGVNIGNVKFLPFSRATQYSQSPAELRGILEGALREISQTGANTIRFWLHIDGSSSPDFGPDGLVSGLPPDLLPDLKWFLQKVHDYKLVSIISLWSHDILAVRRCNPVEHRERALRIFEEDAALNAYVERALKPMLAELGSARMADGKTPFSKAVAAWEIFNEPEEAAFDLEGNTDYMYKGAWGEYKYNNPAAFNADPRRAVDYQNISFMYSEGFIRPDPKDAGDAEYNGFHFVKTWQGQDFFNWYLYHDVFGQFNSDYYYLKDQVLNHGLTTKGLSSRHRIPVFVNRLAGVIHRAAPGALVTVGADSILYNCDRPGLARNDWEPVAQNWYTDARLIAAGGDPQGTLDFYQVHSYPDWSDPAVNAIDRDHMPFFRPKSYFQLDKPLLAGEFWDAVAGGSQGKNPVTPAAWHGLAASGYTGGLGWAWFDVKEEPGVNVAHPWRFVAPHQMQAHWKPLLREMTAKFRDPAHQFKRLQLFDGLEGSVPSHPPPVHGPGLVAATQKLDTPRAALEEGGADAADAAAPKEDKPALRAPEAGASPAVPWGGAAPAGARLGAPRHAGAVASGAAPAVPLPPYDAAPAADESLAAGITAVKEAAKAAAAAAPAAAKAAPAAGVEVGEEEEAGGGEVEAEAAMDGAIINLIPVLVEGGPAPASALAPPRVGAATSPPSLAALVHPAAAPVGG